MSRTVLELQTRLTPVLEEAVRDVEQKLRQRRWGQARGSFRRWTLKIGGLMLALVIVAGFLAVAVPAIQAQQREVCRTRLRQLGIALLEYRDAHEVLPAAAITDQSGKPLLSWRVAILPRLGLGALYEQFHLDEPWDSPHNLALLDQMPAAFVCPSEKQSTRRRGQTIYQVIVGRKGALEGAKPLFEQTRGVDLREVIDGTSSTLMVVEAAEPVPWTKPEDLFFAEDRPLPHFGSHHPGGFQALLGDGGVRFFQHTISTPTLRAIITRDGSEVTGSS